MGRTEVALGEAALSWRNRPDERCELGCKRTALLRAPRKAAGRAASPCVCTKQSSLITAAALAHSLFQCAAGTSPSARPPASSWPPPRRLVAHRSIRSQRRTGERLAVCAHGVRFCGVAVGCMHCEPALLCRSARLQGSPRELKRPSRWRGYAPLLCCSPLPDPQ